MIRYRLDDLGWYQFEWLTQALLKDHLGMGVESWGGHGDHGRDAWCTHALRFPARHRKTKGPFIFQAKFIENANAAGAKPFPRLMAAVKAERAKILLRASQDKTKSRCKQYVLLTNCVLSPDDRKALKAEMSGALPAATTHCLGGNDLSDLLDLNPSLRRSFPQLLSLRDLDTLLASVVNHDIVERSSAAISAARDVAAVFVPTDAYIRAWDVLKKHHFVVLEGPPEMGKSAIGWMIALAQIANGWEANVCDTPDDFFRALRADTSQIFVADDAFGRTEYDPSRGAKWEAQLHRVLSRLGNAHWLVWTSRRHILERARKHMDVQGAASAFPQPGEVLVDASGLTVQDKALILYRHSKHALPSTNVRNLIQSRATSIVHHDAFTPERIRRFVTEAAPHLSEEASTEPDSNKILARIKQEIKNPTDRMRKCFHGLSLPHKWMLLALLESGHYPTTEDVLSTYRTQYGDDESKPSEILDELAEAFVKIKETTQRYVEWIHPSYRDLVIEQLRDGGSLRSEFLNRMNMAGIKLALSDAGGSTGKLRFPLISSAKDWDILEKRTLEAARNSGVEHGTTLLTVLVAALDGASGQERSTILTILKATCHVIREKWDSGQVELTSTAINAYAAASELTAPMEPMPALEHTFQAALASLRRQIEDESLDFLFEYAPLDEFFSVVDAIRKSEPRLLRRLRFPEGLDRDFEALLARVDQELKNDRSWMDKDGYDSEADASFGLAASLELLARSIPEILEAVKPRAESLKRNANSCREKYLEFPEETNNYSSVQKDRNLRSTEPFDVASVFIDL